MSTAGFLRQMRRALFMNSKPQQAQTNNIVGASTSSVIVMNTIHRWTQTLFICGGLTSKSKTLHWLYSSFYPIRVRCINIIIMSPKSKLDIGDIEQSQTDGSCCVGNSLKRLPTFNVVSRPVYVHVADLLCGVVLHRMLSL